MLYLLVVNNPRQMVAAGLGGVASTTADIAALVLLVEVLALSVPLAAFLASTVGAVVNFVLNKYVAFRDRTPITLPQLGRFGIVALATALLMALAMKLVAVELGVPYLIAKLICAASVFVVWTYPAQRRLVFGHVPQHVPQHV